MKPFQFYTLFSTEEAAINYIKTFYERKLSHCPNCKNKKLTWKDSFSGWKCSKCSKRISLKSISFMKDSKKPFKDWLEILFLLCSTKKSYSIHQIYLLSNQTRYETVYHMVLKVRQAMGVINSYETRENYAKIKLVRKRKFLDLRKNKIPYSGYLFYSKSSNRKRDKIRFLINDNTKIQVKSTIDKKLYRHYPYPKILTKNLLIHPPGFERMKQSKLNKVWKNKLQHNFLKIVKGVYHSITLLHLQSIMDEYSFKYNYRYQQNKLKIFWEKCDNYC